MPPSIRCSCAATVPFLAEGPLPGHELRRSLAHLTGRTRPVSDGSLYPAINRLAEAGLLERRADQHAGTARYVLSLTEAGRADMLERLRKPADHEITDQTRFATVPSFLSLFPDLAERHAVLAPASRVPGDTRELLLRRRAPPARRGDRRPLPTPPAPHRPRHQPRRTHLAPRGVGRGPARTLLNGTGGTPVLASWYDEQGSAADVLRVGDLPDPRPGLGEVRVGESRHPEDHRPPCRVRRRAGRREDRPRPRRPRGRRLARRGGDLDRVDAAVVSHAVSLDSADPAPYGTGADRTELPF